MELVKFDNNKLITELRTVCEVFNKNHKNVMRDVHNIINDLPSCSCEFIPQTYTTSQGNTYNTYYLTEKGFYLLTSSFKGSKARKFQSQFFDEFKRLQSENTMLRSMLSTLLKSEQREPLDFEQICSEVKRLQSENTMLIEQQYQEKRTYCISDITQKFKELSPMMGQHILYMDEWLEYRMNGCFPTEYFYKNDTIVSVYDSKRGKYYPRYTPKGCRMVEEHFKEKGYELK